MTENRVLVGMSGGVDSSVAAYMLKQQGMDVVGCTLRLYDQKDSTNDACDAKQVAHRLCIEHTIRDFSADFEDCVIKYFLKTYKEGKTPNPCVFCNKNMKFPCMLKCAEETDCKYIATGHYARIKKDADRYLLLRGEDRKKDQSYMLYSLGQEVLSRVLFPVGELSKEQIRSLAFKAGLSVANKKDSQDICFIKNIAYDDFIKERTKEDTPLGDFVSTDGKILGKHKGIISYTIGQRKGLGISSDEPYYVIEKDVTHNKVVLGRENELYSKRVYVENANFIPFEKLDTRLRLTAKIRYSHMDCPCTVFPTEKGFVIEFDQDQRAVTKGQSAVIYDNEVVVGGGIIV